MSVVARTCSDENPWNEKVGKDPPTGRKFYSNNGHLWLFSSRSSRVSKENERPWWIWGASRERHSAYANILDVDVDSGDEMKRFVLIIGCPGLCKRSTLTRSTFIFHDKDAHWKRGEPNEMHYFSRRKKNVVFFKTLLNQEVCDVGDNSKPNGKRQSKIQSQKNKANIRLIRLILSSKRDRKITKIGKAPWLKDWQKGVNQNVLGSRYEQREDTVRDARNKIVQNQSMFLDCFWKEESTIWSATNGRQQPGVDIDASTDDRRCEKMRCRKPRRKCVENPRSVTYCERRCI
jgi:hypothetical protein